MITAQKTLFAIRSTVLLFFVICVSLLHYLTPLHLPYLHDIYQRLYYLPIILAALWFGFRGGLLCAIVVSIAYAPHILYQWGGQVTMEMEKYLEILLYNIVGGVTGFLSQRERERTLALERSEENLRKSYEALQHQSEKMSIVEEQLRNSERLSSIGEMSAVLAHEIRNPLASIRGTAEIMRGAFQPGEKYHEFLSILIKETDRLNNVVKDFLRFARPVVIRPEPCDVREELETIVTLVSQETRHRQSKVVFSCEALPIIKADSQKLRQGFLNLIQNARQAAGIDGCVWINATSEQLDGHGSIVITIDDNGTGISPDVRDKLFEPFFTTKTDGTGLGLPTTRKIIVGHGGSIDVEASPKGGARFTLRFPVVPPE